PPQTLDLRQCRFVVLLRANRLDVAFHASPRPPPHATLRSIRSISTVCTSSVCTAKRRSTLGPKVVLKATSAASRPRAITMRPMRGMLWRGADVQQQAPKKSSHPAPQDLGSGPRGAPTSPAEPGA